MTLISRLEQAEAGDIVEKLKVANQNKQLVTPEMLQALIRFDADSGLYFWKPRPIEIFPVGYCGNTWNTKMAGKQTLNRRDKDGYIVVRIFTKMYFGHRVAWALHHGKWPEQFIDHINGVRDDNRIENLRDVSHAENCRNQRKHCTNTSGQHGVHWNASSKRWQARIRANDKLHYLGNFADKESAVAARKLAEREFGFHENHGGISYE